VRGVDRVSACDQGQTRRTCDRRVQKDPAYSDRRVQKDPAYIQKGPAYSLN